MVIKGVVKYLLILLGIIVAMGVITVGAMYFFPSVNLFGYQFYHGSTMVEYRKAYDNNSGVIGDSIIKVDGSVINNLDVLVLKSNGFDICVSTFTSATDYAEYFHYNFFTNMNGFKSVEDSAPKVVVTTDTRELITGEGPKKILQIEVQEPAGFFIRQNTTLELGLRASLVNFERLIVESNSGSITFSSETTNFDVDRADFKCSRGKVDLSNIKINNDFNIEKSFGKFIVNNDITANVNINCDEGSFYFKNITNASSEVKVIGENGLISFGDIKGNADVRMHFGLFRAGTIYGEFNALSNPDTGNNSCDYEIGKVLKTVLIDNDSGKVSIGQTSEVDAVGTFSQVEVNSNSGDITIDNCFSKQVKIVNGRGKINLGNCLGALDLSTTYGAVNVSFLTKDATIEGVGADKITQAVNALSAKVLKIETGRENSGDGSINVSNIASNATLLSNGSGKINAKFLEIIGNNKVESKRGRVEVITPKHQTNGYLLKWLAKNSADVQVYNIVTDEIDSFSYAQGEEIDAGDGWRKVQCTNADNPNKLSVSANNSSLKIYDRVLDE